MSEFVNKRSRKIKLSTDDKIFYAVVNIVLTLVLLIVAYPLIYIVSASFSERSAILSGQVWLYPVGFSLEGYGEIFKNKDIWTGYGNSMLYTVFGTALNVFFTMVCAYPLSKRGLPYKKQIMFLFTFTMFFNGGMIPNYMLMKNLHLINTRLVMIIPGLISVYNMIIARTFISNSIPYELWEAAQVDGCSNTRYFFQMVLPLSKAVIAVLALYYAIGHWNAYFNAMLYLSDRSMYPLQLFLREILISNTLSEATGMDPELLAAKQGLADLLKYCLIIVATVPVLIAYPFVQKYFATGVMLGSVKG
ncbi:MAG: carbohydrate ABC transporter permease [Clostridia bacterium]|nr:carbohydrate ABC transporter permease [Clostridia bacterium]